MAAMMDNQLKPGMTSRRRFLKASSAVLGGLVVGAWLPPLTPKSAAAEAVAQGKVSLGDSFSNGFGAFVRVGHDGRVSLISPKAEMGQGIQTGIAMMVAEELEVGLDQIDIQEAPPNAELYTDALLQFQATGGSTSTRYTWEPLRRAGASARMLLIRAAASVWEADPNLCHARDGKVFGPAGQKISYGDLVDLAATYSLPDDVPLKRPEDFRLIGTPATRLDTPTKVNGQAKFTIDLDMPDMLITSARACPVYGGKVRHVDDKAARSVPGVRDIVILEDVVAVTATNTWACFQGLKALNVEWDYGTNSKIDSAVVDQKLQDAIQRDGVIATEKGAIDASLQAANSKFEAVYVQPFLSHSPLEPMSCVAHVRDDGCDLWVGTQVPGFAQQTAAAVTGLKPEQVKVHNQWIGGAFGRRLDFDFITQAVRIASKVSYPVKLTWSREEDMTHDLYRPQYADRMTAAINDDGFPVGWQHRIAGGSIFARYVGSLPASGVDPDAVEVAVDPIYKLDSLKVHFIREEPEVVPVSWWRGVGVLRSTFAVECFVDELAHNAGIDPMAYRKTLLAHKPRVLAALNVLASKGAWDSPLPPGRGRGLAVGEVFGSVVVSMVELSAIGEKGVRIERLVTVVDCGLVINPTSVKAQMEGGTLFGLSAALFNEIDIKDGQVQQENFHAYRQLRISEAPPVEVHIVPSAEAPGGVGEAGTALIGPALLNAVNATFGDRVRRLPLVRSGYFIT
jgi:isoquinoline 1-oxidoreductase beta subunit